ncbi:MAG TPA: outer membrane beta-barrel protein [Kofleriaceae bacterium]|nr:outer membrane beta-barrel protein [Kofleriaceae bacterium]
MSNNRFWISALILGAFSSTAYADSGRDSTYPPYQPEPEQEPMAERAGLSIAVGGGVTGFTGGDLRKNTAAGGGWDVRATLGTRSLLAFEAQYGGSAQSIKALGLDKSAILMSNSAQANVRLNFLRHAPLQPFVFAGVAWRRYDVTKTSKNLSDIKDRDDVLEVPAGLGLSYRWRGLLLDARAEYRTATNPDLMPRLNVKDLRQKAPMNGFGASASIGYEF